MEKYILVWEVSDYDLHEVYPICIYDTESEAIDEEKRLNEFFKKLDKLFKNVDKYSDKYQNLRKEHNIPEWYCPLCAYNKYGQFEIWEVEYKG